MAGRATKKGTGVAKAKNPPDTIPKTGRGNPPKHTQFKKGVSGNKNGRPKGSKNLSTVLMDAARDRVTATIGGKQRRISKLQASVMQLATKAAGRGSSIYRRVARSGRRIRKTRRRRQARRVSLQRSRP